jgi:hypothetical protein
VAAVVVRPVAFASVLRDLVSHSRARIFVVPRTVETRRLKPTVRLTLLNSGLSHADIYSTKGMLNGCFPPVQMAALLSVLSLSPDEKDGYEL